MNNRDAITFFSFVASKTPRLNPIVDSELKLGKLLLALRAKECQPCNCRSK